MSAHAEASCQQRKVSASPLHSALFPLQKLAASSRRMHLAGPLVLRLKESA